MSNNPRIPDTVYALFANIFAKEPNIEFLQLLQLKENISLFRYFGVEPLSDIKHLSLKDQAELLSVEYARLFLAPDRETLPYESVQLGEERLWGESTVKVNEIYEKFGFKLDDRFTPLENFIEDKGTSLTGFSDAPDHLSCELSFLAQLSKLESEYNTAKLIEAKTGVLKVKKHFLDNHLLRWFPGFKDKVIKKAKFSYYKELVKLLDIVLNHEKIFI